MSCTRTRIAALVAVIAFALFLTPSAFAQQSVTLSSGYFAIKGADTRIERDVLLENQSLFAICLEDFNGGTFGGSWNAGIGEHFEASVGLGFYQRTVPSVYREFINDDGSEIAQDFRLRIVPVTATIRVLPFGAAPIQPYFGGGLGLYNWWYSEVGEFIDFTDFSVFRDRFVATGNDVGGVVLGGIRFPFADKYAVGAEVQYHQAKGVVGIDQGFLEDEIDLGGLSTQFTFQVRF